jgi:hypothetical protein
MEKLYFGEIGENGGDKERVEKTVHQIRSLLKQIIESDECDFIFFQDLLNPMKKAWVPVSERFLELERKVSESSDSALQEHGLTGLELKYKLSVINYASNYFFDFLSKKNAPLAVIWLKKLLEALDKFLSSLLDAIGCSGAIGEYKSFMESSIDDTQWFLRYEYFT